jgi:hypothetical protein
MASDNSALVLLHGILTSGNAWQDVVPLLSNHHQVFAVTAAGHRGGPPAPRRPATVRDLVGQMNTWSTDRDGRMLTADEARQHLAKIIADRDLVGANWGDLVRIDKALRLRPPLTYAAFIKHRDSIMEDPEMWGSLHDTLRAWMILLNDDQVNQLVAMIVEGAIEHYRQMPDDDEDGDWWLWDRDNRRVLTKVEAERALIEYVMKGDRQDLLDRLADLNDSFRTMLLAVPLESEAATSDLVRTVVKDVVAKEYWERCEG